MKFNKKDYDKLKKENKNSKATIFLEEYGEIDLKALKEIRDKKKKTMENKQIDFGDTNPYDEEGNAKHYDDTRINSMVILERSFGTYEAMIFCEMNAMKYRLRIGKKDDPFQELLKIAWYERAAKYFKDKLHSSSHITGMGPKNKPLQWKDDE